MSIENIKPNVCLPSHINLELSSDNILLYKSVTIYNINYIPILKTEYDELKNNIEEYKIQTTNLQKVINKLKRKNFKLSQKLKSIKSIGIGLGLG